MREPDVVLATFSLGQPALLVLAITLLALGGVILRDFHLQTAGQENPARSSGFAVRLPRAVLAAGMALLFGIILVSLDTLVSKIVLLLVALGLAWRLSRQIYVDFRTRLPENTWRSCRLLRGIGLLALVLLIARPGCTWSEVTWQKPLLVALIDQSRSMSIRDTKDGSSRAETVNAALRDTFARSDALLERFDVQVFGFGRETQARNDWQSQPADDITGIAAGLRYAAQARSASGDSPQAVILVSDGAETASDPQLIRQIAEDYARRRIALHALGASTGDLQTVGISLDPLRVPHQVGLRERIQLGVGGRVQGGAGGPISVAILWNGITADSTTIPVEAGAARWQSESAIQPPGPGLHQLTVSASIALPGGKQTAEQTAIVEVREDMTKVLFLDDALRTETAFAGRALRTDPAFRVSQRVLSRTAGDAIPNWREFDLVVLGSLAQRRIDIADFSGLAKAVQEGGVGLLIAADDTLFGVPSIARSDLAAVSPVDFSDSEGMEPVATRCGITDEGLRHPIFAGSPPASVKARQLAVLTLGARLGKSKPLAQTLLSGGEQLPVLVVHEAGRGRCAIAAWSATWPWALESDEGLAGHRTLWRQMARWLVNRRPAAWVVTDRNEYSAPSLSAETSIHIRAGVTGDNAPILTQADALAPVLRMRRLGESDASQPSVPSDWVKVPLNQMDREWRGELNARNWPIGSLMPGDYLLEFSIANAEGRQGISKSDEELLAQTRFRVVGIDPELRSPTANIAILKEAAAISAGGGYRNVQEAKATLEQLLATDMRRRIERLALWDFTERLAWVMLLAASAAFGGEWLLRKHAGLR